MYCSKTAACQSGCRIDGCNQTGRMDGSARMFVSPLLYIADRQEVRSQRIRFLNIDG
jgi:hypothetical protein